MLQVRPEQRGARSTEFGDYLKTLGCLTSTWLPEFSKRRRSYGWDVPSLDIDALLYNPVTSNLLAIFETKHGTEGLSRAEREVIVDLANKCQKPAFCLRYRTVGDSWMIQPLPLNGYATDFIRGDYELYPDEFEDFLRSLGWNGYVEAQEQHLFFPMIEFDKFQVKSLIAYRPVNTKFSLGYLDTPEFKLWAHMANACEVPALSVVFESSTGWFKTYPINDTAREYCTEGQLFSEEEFVKWLYRIHTQPMPLLPALRKYRPPAYQGRIPPNPPRNKAKTNRLLYSESKKTDRN